MHTRATSRGPSANRRGSHISRDTSLQHRNGKFPCVDVDKTQQARILSKLRTLRGTIRADIHGDILTCVFAPQRRRSLNKLIKRISRMIRDAKQHSTSQHNLAFA